MRLNRAMEEVFSTRTVDPLSREEVAETVAHNFGVVFDRKVPPAKLDDILPKTGVPARPPAELRKLHDDEIALG